jgi:hypothetical protein
VRLDAPSNTLTARLFQATAGLRVLGRTRPLPPGRPGYRCFGWRAVIPSPTDGRFRIQQSRNRQAKAATYGSGETFDPLSMRPTLGYCFDITLGIATQTGPLMPNPRSTLSFSGPPIRQGEPADAAWITDFLRERWNATMIVVHGESIDAATLPALIAGDYQGLATFRLLGHNAERFCRKVDFLFRKRHDIPLISRHLTVTICVLDRTLRQNLFSSPARPRPWVPQRKAACAAPPS